MSQNHTDDITFIQALADLIIKTDMGEIDVEQSFGEPVRTLKVRLTKQTTQTFVNSAPMMMQAGHAHIPQTSSPALASAAAPAHEPSAFIQSATDHPGCVASPMVGTAYLAPEPGASNFVKIGDHVKEGQTLLIVEAMKTMNQIPASRAGIIKQILVDSGQPVEYGAALMIIE